MIEDIIRQIGARILAPGHAPLDLTPSEIEVLTRIGQGMAYREIAADLGLKRAGQVANCVLAITKRTKVNKHRLVVYGAFLHLALGGKW